MLRETIRAPRLILAFGTFNFGRVRLWPASGRTARDPKITANLPDHLHRDVGLIAPAPEDRELWWRY